MAPSGYHISNVIIPASSFALVSVAMAKDYLEIPANDLSKDGQIGQQIAQVSASINTYCDRVFVQQTYRDQFRSSGSWLAPGSPLVMRQRPIVVTGVTIDGALLVGSDWEIDAQRGQLYRLDSSGGVSAWSGTVTLVDYQGGYQLIPEDVQAAALCWVSIRWASRSQTTRDPTLRSLNIPDVVSETYDTSGGGESYSSMGATGVPADLRDTLDNYRLWTV